MTCPGRAFHITMALNITVHFIMFVFTLGRVNLPSVACLVLYTCSSELKDRRLYKTLGSLVTDIFQIKASNEAIKLFFTFNQARQLCVALTFVRYGQQSKHHAALF